MDAGWSPDELDRIGAAEELTIATVRSDGSWRGGVPIWVVRVGADVVVRTWFRRDTGWFGAAVAHRRARVLVAGLEVEVIVEDVGDSPAERRESVDVAYRTKYGGFGRSSVEQMTSDAAAASTLRLVPDRGVGAAGRE